MNGTATGSVFKPGTSNKVCYSGVDDPNSPNPCATPDPSLNLPAVPSIGVSDPALLQYILTHPPQTPPNPLPALLGDEKPDWMKSSTNLDFLVGQFRASAQNSLRYYQLPTKPSDFGSPDGTGITFCEGNCTLQGDGGGILIVTGKLTLKGNFSFRGLILVTGAGGVDRQGAGNGQIIGNLIIAPYDSSGFLPPKYDMSGGGISDIVYNSSSVEFDGLAAVSNFMQGVAEK